MYTGFDLDLSKEKMELLLSEYRLNNSTSQYWGQIDTGIVGKSPAYGEIEQQMQKNIASVLPRENVLPEWEPGTPESKLVKADIFLAHSERDADVAKALADWISRNFNLRVFLGSWFREHSDMMQKEIRDRAGCNCIPPEKAIEIENVTVNGTLMQIIDTTECFIFLNTKNALEDMDPSIAKENYSGRLYFELLTTSLIRRSFSERQKKKQIKMAKLKFSERPAIKNIPPGSHLLPLTGQMLDQWYIRYGEEMLTHPLDLLYDTEYEMRK